jgi:biopolymer transport protein ExbD
MKGRRARNGLLPFLDLLFILLFSMLAMTETRKTTSEEPVRIRLPEVEAGESDDATNNKTTIVLEIDAESDIRLAGSEAVLDGPAALDALLRTQLKGQLPEECQIEIHGDTKADHGTSVALLQHLRKLGFGSVVLLATGGTEGVWK